MESEKYYGQLAKESALWDKVGGADAAGHRGCWLLAEPRAHARGRVTDL